MFFHLARYLLISVCGAAALQPAIAPADLRAHVEFLSSDALEGRATPSKSLDIAAEYIAAQFHRAGLQPPPDRTWFQAGEQPGTRNVIGVLKGSSEQYVLVTAHYDHIGLKKKGEGDLINNGANDNASGVASLIEIARTLAAARPVPKRSIVFIAFYGEELGLVGSRFYAAHPVFPLDQTAAQINLEQTGRTDDLEGPNAGILNVTGYRYSEVASILAAATASSGVRVLERTKWTDAAFERSDNEALAKEGVPAHTLSASYMFPDYHRPGDEWSRLDYENMSKVTAAAAAGVLALANRSEPPHWYSDAPVGVGSSAATKLSTPITRPAAPPAASGAKSGKSRATQPPRRSAPSSVR